MKRLRPRRVLLGFALFLSGCQSDPTPRLPVIGEAFAGPATLEIRKEIAPKSGVAATVHYGEKLQILQQRRHFVRVRTAKGAEGWVDERLLLDRAAIDALRQLSKDTQQYPSQGKATTYDVLNVHVDPNRLSPSYLQVQAGERVDVIGHKMIPRAAPLPKRPVLLTPKPARKAKEKKKEKSGRVPPPPAPPAPKPPADWVELSKERSAPSTPAPEPETAAEAVAPDDWTLIRNASGQSGWVLTRRIYMAIPDEVAQYAEGRRISSYFSLGKVKDEDLVKDTWLWTTIDSGSHPYDFDSFRVFLWNAHRHRYETAYIQRRIEGFFPVRAGDGKFSLVLAKDDGRRYRQSFELVGNRVQLTGEQVE